MSHCLCEISTVMITRVVIYKVVNYISFSSFSNFFGPCVRVLMKFVRKIPIRADDAPFLHQWLGSAGNVTDCFS